MNKTSKSPAITMCTGAGVEVKLFLKKDDGGSSAGAVCSGQSPKQMSTTSVSVTQDGSFYCSGHFHCNRSATPELPPSEIMLHKVRERSVW